MKTYHRHILFAVFLAIGLFVINWINNDSQQLMPELSFTDIDGNEHSMSEYQGKPLLVIFWATDCPGCIAEMPSLIKLHQEFAPKGLNMLGVAMSHDSPEHIKAMRSAKALPYTITWDHNASIALAFGNVRVTPTHFLIAPNGEIIMRKIGTLNHQRLEDKLHGMGL